MILKPEPIFAAVEALTGEENGRQQWVGPQSACVVLLSPQGRVLTQKVAESLAQSKQIIVICGRYEGVDERVVRALATDEVSIGDYVLSGGEPAAVVLIDAVARLVPGVLGSDTSAINDSFSDGLLDCPHYTRPAEFRGMRVPEILLSGNHAQITQWRRKEALRKTKSNRPDLLERGTLSERERMWLDEINQEQ